MEKNAATCLLYVPCPDLDTAGRLGRMAVGERLAGCVNILPAMVSIYEWQGAVEEAAECVLLAKTTLAAAPRLRALLEREHPYEIPAILTLPLSDVNAAYRDWLAERIAPGAGAGEG
ncbi:divalent-cation tolerance protein CutA [Faunimonas sp. B44]|uniref:divalent-cation tolerance protein CutA n=1 Tax=Faunimonas sp. B44 TaxID=3461493 RepID=UPI004044298C